MIERNFVGVILTILAVFVFAVGGVVYMGTRIENLQRRLTATERAIADTELVAKDARALADHLAQINVVRIERIQADLTRRIGQSSQDINDLRVAAEALDEREREHYSRLLKGQF